MADTDIDTGNYYGVGMLGTGVTLLNPPQPRQPLSKAQALTLAAWLVALADRDDEFPAVLAAVKNT